MPFASKSQLRTCYGKNDKAWNCKEFLRKTPSVCCLDEKKTVTKSRCKGPTERIVGKITTGPRGGRYFVIREKTNCCNKACTVKVYVKK